MPLMTFLQQACNPTWPATLRGSDLQPCAACICTHMHMHMRYVCMCMCMLSVCMCMCMSNVCMQIRAERILGVTIAVAVQAQS